MAAETQKHPITLIKDALGSPLARQVLGALSTEDLHVLAKAAATGELNKVAKPILGATDPLAQARVTNHPVASVLAKLQPKHLNALAAVCPNCPP